MPADRASCLALAGAALVVAACRPGASGPNVVTVTAKDYTFDAPAEAPAGLTTFRLINAGPSLHHLQLIRLEVAVPRADLKGPGCAPKNDMAPVGAPCRK